MGGGKVIMAAHRADVLSIEECRRLMGSTAASLTDAEVADIRDALYCLVRAARDVRRRNQGRRER